jgi:hypothetical protein
MFKGRYQMNALAASQLGRGDNPFGFHQVAQGRIALL